MNRYTIREPHVQRLYLNYSNYGQLREIVAWVFLLPI